MCEIQARFKLFQKSDILVYFYFELYYSKVVFSKDFGEELIMLVGICHYKLIPARWNAQGLGVSS